MSDKARKLIKQAIQSHLDDDGASDIGAYRDVVTEVLHFAYKELRKKTTKTAEPTLDYLNTWICSMGFEAFQEEIELAEIEKVNKIPDKKLPLHTVDEFQLDSAKTQFVERLKTGSKYYGEKVPGVLMNANNGKLSDLCIIGTYKEASEFSKLSIKTLYCLVSRHEIPQGVYLGHGRWNLSRWQEFINKNGTLTINNNLYAVS
jgi:hypothetical protein